MKQLLGVLGFLALAQGVLGLLHEFTRWHVGLVRRLGFLDGYEVYASIALIVLAFALFAASGSWRPG
ncbi:hypothetical protein OHS71_09750 [Streptomyces sp. NBC_00377]|uniref:hypothetical protein n=1 Tax=unclassified Streptomyces TaxID=2593676 RepID=UPI002E1EAF4B|nr:MULTISPECIES: hypothetical protein [unclassified Streptomyces]